MAQEDKVKSILDKTTNASYIYYCETKKLDAALSDPVWQCTRFTIASGVDTYANGNDNYTNIASNRASLTYTE